MFKFPYRKVRKAELRILEQEIWQKRIQISWLTENINKSETTEELKAKLGNKVDSILAELESAYEYREFLNGWRAGESWLVQLEGQLMPRLKLKEQMKKVEGEMEPEGNIEKKEEAV